MSEDDQGDLCDERITRVIAARDEHENQLGMYLENSQSNVFNMRAEMKMLQEVYQDVTNANKDLREDNFALHANVKAIRDNTNNFRVAEELMEKNLRVTELNELLASSIDVQKTSEANQATIKRRLGTTQDNLATTIKTLETTKDELQTTKDELETTKNELETSQNSEENQRAELETRQHYLDSTQRNLNSTNEHLTAVYNALNTEHADLETAVNKLEITQTELSTVKDEMATVKDEMATVRQENEMLQREIYGYIQKDDFVRDDDFDDGRHNGFDSGQMRMGEDSESDDGL